MTEAMRRRLISYALAASLLLGCQSTLPQPESDLEVVQNVDLQRFMGSWFVVAAIPVWIEREAFNAVESYSLNSDGTIATVYTFRKGAFDGPLKRYTPTGFVLDSRTNAVWGMQFIWPFKADYRIIKLSPDYRYTVIGRRKRDFVWIMSRTPMMAESEYRQLVDFVKAVGYDIERLRRVPQRW